MSKRTKAVDYWFPTDRTKTLAMKQEPAIRAMRKAYRASKQFQLDNLLARERRWKSKTTLAQNKLAEVREEINDLLKSMVQQADREPAALLAPEKEGAK